MLPPVSDEVLRNNPGFASLYWTLTNVVLNPDGSTRDAAAAKNRVGAVEELRKHRISAARARLIEYAIVTAISPDATTSTRPDTTSTRSRQQWPSAAHDSKLPEPLLNLLTILPPLFDENTSLSVESEALLLASPPLSDFEVLLPQLAALVSSSLHSSAMELARLFHPNTNPSNLHLHTASLSKDYAELVEELSDSHGSLAAARLRVLSSLNQLLQCHSELLDHLIRSLEAKHGVLARSIELRASDISLRAQHSQLETASIADSVARAPILPQTAAALRNYAAQLKEMKLQTAVRMRSLLVQLEGDVDAVVVDQDGKVVTDMSRLYRETTRQIEDMKRTLEQLALDQDRLKGASVV